MNNETVNSTKEALAEAFCSLYSKMPLERITVQAVARKAGYNRSTFYQYFSDINDLLEHVESNLLDFIKKRRKNETETDRDTFLENIFSLYREKSLYIDALMGDYGSNRFLDRAKDILRQNVCELSMPDENPLKPYLIEFRISSALALFHLWKKRGKDLPSNDFLKLVSDLYLYGTSAYSYENSV
ncbi:MAG: TetR/AcrR family transcriptional regulator [Faecousia sp.]